MLNDTRQEMGFSPCKAARGFVCIGPGRQRHRCRPMAGMMVGLSLAAAIVVVSSAHAQTSSVLVRLKDTPAPPLRPGEKEPDPGRQLHGISWFTIPEPEPIAYRKHDLIQIIIRETSTATSKQNVDYKKQYDNEAAINDFPKLKLSDILDGVLQASTNVAPPKLDITSKTEFKGDGQYKRTDDLSARVTAEVIDVLPNGNLELEARTYVQTDAEKSTIMLSGIVDPRDVSSAGTVLSNQLFDLRVIKMHEGDLKQTSKKGLIPRVLETIFAF